ncbi:hypothetical protein EMWEY_00013080 [Eimeria maxima]|uniref:Uncharacterized protein n=1 Tax=Eimeria maxima TaxID=5804 RepID=U6M1U5_EIMMA|nr:hypothetical protein EMWEY_00013080 [Eimeria maxima]CDJ57996.1 hypothetical protein EMWEY_00013080 [Eimeria maxima]
MQQASALAGVEEAGVGFLRPTVEISGKDTRTARRRSGGTQSVLRWMIVTLIAFAVTFLIISCVRGPRPRAVQTYAWRRLAGSEGDDDKDDLCPKELLQDQSEGTHAPQGEQEVPTEAGGDDQQQQEGPLGGAAMGEGRLQAGDSLGGASGGVGQQQAGESVGGAASGQGQQESVESTGAPALDEEQGAKVQTTTLDEGKLEAVTPNASESPATEDPTPGPSRVSGKKKAKTKHLESPRQPLPHLEEEDEYGGQAGRKRRSSRRFSQASGQDEDSDGDDEDDTPTYRWPRGVLYDTRPENFPPPPKRRKVTTVSKPEVKPKPEDTRQHQTKQKGPKHQRIKLKTLVSILEESMGLAEDVSSSGGEENVASACWLLNEVVQALSVQVAVAREGAQDEPQEEELQELCGLAEAARLVAEEWISSHGGTVTEARVVKEGRRHEEERSQVAVRLLVLTLAAEQIRKQSSALRARLSDQNVAEVNRVVTMAKPLVASTESMLKSLRLEKQHAAAQMVCKLLGELKRSKGEAEAVLLSHKLAAAVPLVLLGTEEAVQDLMDSLGVATTRVEALLARLEAGADSNVQREAQEEVQACRSLLFEVNQALQSGGWQTQRLTDPAFILQDKVDLLEAVLESAKL